MLPPSDPRLPPSRPYSLHRSDAVAPVAVPRRKAAALGVGLLALTGLAVGLFVTLDRNVSINPIDEPYRGQIKIEPVKGQPTAPGVAPVVAAPYPEASSSVVAPAISSPAIYPARYAATPTPAAPAPAVRAAPTPASAPAPVARPTRVLTPAPGETVTLQADEAPPPEITVDDDAPPPDRERRRRHRDRDAQIVDEDGNPAPDVVIVDEPQP